VTIENTGTVDAYADVELVDLWINGEYVTISSDDIIQIGPGHKKVIAIKADLSEEDLSDSRNSKIKVRAVYGARKHALIKIKEKEFELKTKTGFIWWYIPIIIVLILLILFIIFWRRRKRCPRCRTMNKRSASHCKKCGHPFSERHVHQGNQNQKF
jgi:hypothetical protein